MIQIIEYTCIYSEDKLVLSWDFFDASMSLSNSTYSVDLCLTTQNVEDIVTFISSKPNNNDVFEIRLTEAVWSVAFVDDEYVFEVETTAGFINVYIPYMEWHALANFLNRFLLNPGVPTF